MSAAWIAEVLERLRADVASANRPGNIEGLLARHLVGDDPRLRIRWTVDCDEIWLTRSYDPSSLPSVAALGYTIADLADGRFLGPLEEGLQRAISRDPAMAGHGAALHDPAVLIGLALGAQQFSPDKPQYTAWCAAVVRQLVETASAHRVDPMLTYAALLCHVEVRQPPVEIEAPLVYCAGLDWWLRRNGQRAVPPERLRALRESVVERALGEMVGHLAGHQAALIWRCLMLAVSEVTTNALRTSSTVVQVLRQFESCMRRWRWDADGHRTPVRWEIRGEREIQDILWLLLRAICDDLEDEDTLPKFGHSTYRADFGVPSLSLLIEVKYARSAVDFKQIEKEVLEDIVPYLRSPERYREVLIFIYDESCSVQEHATTQRALRSVAGVADVIIVSRPSQLPTRIESAEAKSR